jgi:hypothetical protein
VTWAASRAPGPAGVTWVRLGVDADADADGFGYGCNGAKGSKGCEGANLAGSQRAKRDELGQQKGHLLTGAPLFVAGCLVFEEDGKHKVEGQGLD